MADPQVKFGGVSLNKREVSSMNKRVHTDCHGNKSEVYVVEFKNGVKAAYRESQNASISSSAQPWGDTNTNIYGVMGLELKGTKYMDNIKVKNGSMYGVDLIDNGTGEEITVDKTKVETKGYPSGFASQRILGGGDIYVDQDRNRKDYTKIRNIYDTDFVENARCTKFHNGCPQQEIGPIYIEIKK